MESVVSVDVSPEVSAANRNLRAYPKAVPPYCAGGSYGLPGQPGLHISEKPSRAFLRI